MIVAEHREGDLSYAQHEGPSNVPGFFRSLDRNISLGLKLIVPVIVITLVGTTGFGIYEAEQTNFEVDHTYETSAAGAAQAASSAFYNTFAISEGINIYLADLASGLPNVEGIWVVNLAAPGTPVEAASNSSEIGKTGLLDGTEIENIEAGKVSQEHKTVAGVPVLETLAPVKGNAYGVIVMTSLAGEDQVLRSKLIGSLIVGTLISGLEIAALFAVLSLGIFRRIRRIGLAVDSFGFVADPLRLDEGLGPPGRDALFNLARSVDRKLQELGQHQRAEGVVTELGRLALEGVDQAQLTSKALEITRKAGDLERCFVVDTGGRVTVIQSTTSGQTETTEAKLPIWLGALARSAAQGRRAVVTEGLGQGSHYSESGDGAATGAAVFVPLAGNPAPIGVMVGVARPGAPISNVTVSMMEAVATALGESLQRTNAEKARHESDAKSKALHTVSHEIRNPLNAMLGFTDLLLSGTAGPLSEKQTSYLRRVDDAGHHLLRLVNDYLDLAKVMSGSLPVQTEPIAVASEVQSVIDLLRPSAEAKTLKLHAEIAPDVVARADRLRLRQVLMNLISNAIKFTPAGGHVRVEVAGGSNGVRISVIDTGIGIPADRQHLVFTEFAQLSTQRSEGTGPGLGLALTKRLVEAMNGFIRFTSAEGAGTIFDVWLPGEQSPVARPESPAVAGEVLAS